MVKCHEVGVIHRDLKHANIMVRRDLSVSLVDFGYGRVLPKQSHLTLTKYCGTPYYLSPDILAKKGYNGNYISRNSKLTSGFKADMWSFGVVYFKLITGKFPFDSSKNCKNDLYFKILNEPVKTDESLSEEDQQLIKFMLHKDPTQRIDFNYLIKLLNYIC
jgi:serine/threonine protein kinase